MLLLYIVLVRGIHKARLVFPRTGRWTAPVEGSGGKVYLERGTWTGTGGVVAAVFAVILSFCLWASDSTSLSRSF